MSELLTIDGLSKAYFTAGRQVAALDNVSLGIAAGETLGLVGASGSGKSTLSRVLLRLMQPDSGCIRFEGEDWLSLRGAELRRRRARMQLVFQDTLGAFNPLATVASGLSDPLRIHGIADRKQRQAEIITLLERVGLPAAFASRPVHTLSGGQRQRVAIARAVATRPSLLVLDEAVSALDVTIRGRILELLVALQRERGLAYLFISHDLAVVRAISHRIAIMDAGRVVEEGPAADVVTAPRSDAARRLIAAVPRLVTEPV
ncbi:peptide/nickel transport system ATP-binding protein [Rhizobium sp. BK529]|uniref:ABC transporter ATP-binding protein n=1 Tax=unclassified Rhizobium TaxID=2613769 RepID=UPI001053FC32|nr:MULTISPECIES: dipeptide/oligopeptide/nickel ABC transporter ATP-binding protein [unclassified Rhizobium]MBB3593520.1 peptide/nickel transport system ATP-binding protein [Rhizobium sp. BK529]TCS03308.1 peptide/nickel transport system ATP-binding protein [Rhizobium sp. BK418]